MRRADGRVVLGVVIAACVAVAVAATLPAHRGEVAATPSADATADVSFDVLAGFEFVPPPVEYDADGTARPPDPQHDSVPRAVRALSGRRVAVSGYMIPYNFDEGRCTRFALTQFGASCCFGCTATQNNWIEVTMSGDATAKCANGEIVRVVGVLDVAPLGDELATLYAIRGESVAADPPR